LVEHSAPFPLLNGHGDWAYSRAVTQLAQPVSNLHRPLRRGDVALKAQPSLQ
jgi:hypothetical protein